MCFHHSNQNSAPQAGYPEYLSPYGLSIPHRRNIAIHDLLNPVEQGRSGGLNGSCASPAATVVRGISISDIVSQDSGRTSLSSSIDDRRRRTVSMSPASRSRDRRAFRPTDSDEVTVSMSSASRPRRRRASRPRRRRASRPGRRRAFRPSYSDEEVNFIWYHRIDLGYDWKEINQAYNAQFPDRQRAGFGGIQCKYYRYCDESGIPKVRDRDRRASAVKEYGMRSRTGLTYSWMRM